MISPYERQARERGLAAYIGIASRYAQLALERLGLNPRAGGDAIPQRKRSPKRFTAGRRPAASPPPNLPRDCAAHMRTRRQLAEVFKFAQERNAVDFALACVADGWKTHDIAGALRAMPLEGSRPRGGLAERVRQRDALAAMPVSGNTPNSAAAAAMIAAYNKVVGGPGIER